MSNLGKWKRIFIGAVVGSFVGITQSSWVDPDTPAVERAPQRRSLTPEDDRHYSLVFSDEFEVDGRTFHDGYDSRWTAINKNDYTNKALHFYSSENAKTKNGVLKILTEQKENSYKAFDETKKVFYADKKYIQSAMLQSWNKFCFVGGIIEFKARLPGDPKVGGLWPALWMLGNLARATYVGSSDYMWPFSYNRCDSRTRLSQEIDACAKVNHYGMEAYVGRGAPEIDIIEAMQGELGTLPNTNIQRPYQSTSLQIAPGVEIDRPMLGKRPHEGHWYEDLDYGNGTNITVDLNPFFYGVTLIHKPKQYTYQADAISANLQLNDTHYNSMHVYRVEWEPPAEDGSGGYVKWFTDNEFIFGINGDSLSIMQTEIPSEPMYLLMNTAVSSSWGFPAPCPENCECECFECGNPACQCALPTDYCKNFPAIFEIDYVRVYQAVNESKHILGCSPKSRPTEKWIEGHAKRYMEEGDKTPLRPLQTGGMPCEKDRDCGGKSHGLCSSGRCACQEGYTGPSCLAHFGVYDEDTGVQPEPFLLSYIVIPRSLLMTAFILVTGFLLSLLRIIQLKSEEARYQKIPNVGSDGADAPGASLNGPATSYQQNPPQFNYAVPEEKINTYCVIDSRLVDS